jgi:hypothetical protein
MWPFENRHCSKKLIRITPIDPSGLNSATTTAKSTSTIPGITAATIAQAWSIVTLTNELGQPPMTVVGDALIVVIGNQPWAIIRFISTVQTVSANGIVQALSYQNYFEETIEVA